MMFISPGLVSAPTVFSRDDPIVFITIAHRNTRSYNCVLLNLLISLVRYMLLTYFSVYPSTKSQPFFVSVNSSSNSKISTMLITIPFAEVLKVNEYVCIHAYISCKTWRFCVYTCNLIGIKSKLVGIIDKLITTKLGIYSTCESQENEDNSPVHVYVVEHEIVTVILISMVTNNQVRQFVFLTVVRKKWILLCGQSLVIFSPLW